MQTSTISTHTRQVVLAALFLLTFVGAGFGQSGQNVSAEETAATSQISPEVETSGSAQQMPYVRPDSKTRARRYAKSMFGYGALGRTAFNASMGTIANHPNEWGGQWKGFGKRVASDIGKRVIGQSIAYGLDEAFKLDPHYYRSEKKGIGARAGHAILSTFTERTSTGKRTFAAPRFIGNYAASVIAAKTWYPDRFTAKDGLRSATIGIAFGAFYNLIKEFVHK